uniref:Uncharacterized protein n=1 Tax=Glossina pallidipes TaxID=7398 RepID=A0A1A9ZAL1_GLOPL
MSKDVDDCSGDDKDTSPRPYRAYYTKGFIAKKRCISRSSSIDIEQGVGADTSIEIEMKIERDVAVGMVTYTEMRTIIFMELGIEKEIKIEMSKAIERLTEK